MYGELCVFKPLGLVVKYMKFSRRVLGSIPMMTAGVRPLLIEIDFGASQK